ncbi:hypothetical protein DTO164E3_8259 [Paecilomyces variotii]|nr:hypothetical protein DTO164E3_8259 [Paecilomyces variotii]KAJ9366919.1 hypothetical protein DTO282E5_8412 [Paecilomyces variotii]
MFRETTTKRPQCAVSETVSVGLKLLIWCPLALISWDFELFPDLALYRVPWRSWMRFPQTMYIVPVAS